MTPLKEKLVRQIALAGPLRVSDYMSACLFDPEHGYYTTREPFGRAGDFITAPEISQMFGELVAVWLYAAWKAAGGPLPATLAEIGPGRGTLMKDMLRTLQRLDPGFVARADVALIEASPRLTGIQKKLLEESPARPVWHSSVAGLAEQPLFIVGNELFDALPVRQFTLTDRNGWREVTIIATQDGGLTFAAGPGMPDPAFLPPDAKAAQPGAIVEIAPARTALMSEIAARIARSGGAGLFFDYGHTAPATGDTLQALHRGAPDPALAHPGEADLTSHVDFAALAAAARAEGLTAKILTQGKFLLSMGLLERAGRLGAGADQATQDAIRADVERLAGPDQMGNLFKVLAILPEGVSVPPF